MLFQPYYLGCLAHASYLIGSDGEAAVVDPQRDVDLYLDAAERLGLEIRHVIETHLHADFVSGHRELAERTGAQIYFGRRSGATLPHVAVHDGLEIALGRARLRLRETPGHTPESVSVLMIEPGAEAPSRVLTGDALFVGEVGRPDLVAAKGFTAAEMAAELYDSLHGKLLALADDVEVWPAHGAGSACGRNIGEARSSTIGQERRHNYALQPMTREAFVALVTTGISPAPAYFGRDAEKNRAGAPALVSGRRPPPLGAADLERLSRQGVVVDTRRMEEFAKGHIPGALFIGLQGSFAPWAGTLLPHDRPIALVVEDERRLDEAVVRLARVGLDEVAGYLDGGMFSWRRQLRPTPGLRGITVEALRPRLGDFTVVDVRRPPEFAAGHIPGALSMPLDQLASLASSLERDRPLALVCGTGYRSTIGASLLARSGFGAVVNVVGGMRAWPAQAALPTVEGQQSGPRRPASQA